MPHDFWVTISDRSPRHAQWLAVLGTDRVPVLSPLSHLALLPGRGPSRVFLVALDQLTAGQRERLLDFLCARFDVPRDEGEREMAAHGVPILDEDVIVSVHNPQRWLT
jgi:hypothetical protein